MGGYKLFRRERWSRRGSGVVLYIRDCFGSLKSVIMMTKLSASGQRSGARSAPWVEIWEGGYGVFLEKKNLYFKEYIENLAHIKQ